MPPCDRAGVCRTCAGPAALGASRCFACRVVARALAVQLAAVFPVRLCPLPSALYTVLIGYKESPVGEARHRFAPMVRHLWCRFVAAHHECLARSAGGSFHLVVPVPSTARPTGAPLAAVEGLAADAERLLPKARWSPGVLARAAGAVGHMRANVEAFTVPDTQHEAISRRRVLLLDDTYVSGARSQSAAAALRRSGASSVVIVALGRVLRPDRSVLHADFVRHNRRGVGDQVAVQPEPCCRCVQTAAGTE